jgi:hypothetical protein
MNGELRRIKESGNDLLPGNILDFQEKKKILWTKEEM